MADVITAMEIDAPVTRVWDLLTDFSSYPRWNPLIPKAEGELALGKVVTIHIQLPVGPKVPVPVKVTKFKVNEELEWVSEIPILGLLLKGRHYHRLEDLSENDKDGQGKTRLVHGEEFTGFAEPLMRAFIENELTPYYRDFNFALKQEAERPV